MNSSKIVLTFLALIFYNSIGAINHPAISYHIELDASFLNQWWDANYSIFYHSTASSWGWGRDDSTPDYRGIDLRLLVQKFMSLLDSNFCAHGPNAIYINQKCIVDGPLIIKEAGIYHLQESITAISGMPAIIIAADNVILNLNGFTISGCDSGADSVIIESNITLVTICNGKICDAGANGIYMHPYSNGVNLIELEIQGSLMNGVFSNANRLLVFDCKAVNNQESGFWAEGSSYFENCLACQSAPQRKLA